MPSGLHTWSQTAANNGTADSAINYAEGMAPSALNDSARAAMAVHAKHRDDTAGSLTTGGSSTAYTLTTNTGFTTLALLNGQKLRVKFNAANGASPTLNVDTLGAKAIQVDTSTAVGTGVIKANSIWDVTYDNSNSCFILCGVPAQVQDGTVATASIAASAVTNAKLANMANGTLKGRATSGSGDPEDLTIGAGLVLSGTTITAPAVPVLSAFKNLSIKVATTTTVTVAADFVVTSDGTNYQTTALSGTIDLGTNGAANALDTGSIAIDKWYSIWAIAKADGTTAGLASLSASSPTMPTGYTYKARIGYVRTIHGSATLYGTWQFGRKAQYIIGLASTGNGLPVVASGSSGSVTIPTWTTCTIRASSSTGSGILHVPITATAVRLYAWTQNATGSVIAAPSNSYGAFNSTTAPPPIYANNPNCTGEFVLESDAVYYAASQNGIGLSLMGWEDNI